LEDETVVQEKNSGDGTQSIFKVTGMDCADEIKAIQSALKVEGVYLVRAQLINSSVTVLHSNSLSQKEVSNLIEKAGVKVVQEKIDQMTFPRLRIALVVASGVFCGLGVLGSSTVASSFVPNILFVISVILGGYLVFPKAVRAIRQKSIDMNVLMTVAVVGAFAIGEHAEAAAVVFLFSLAELLESLSVMRARKAIKDVLNLAPKLVKIKSSSGKWEDAAIEEVKVDSIIQIVAGDRIPLDGFVTSGQASVNQAPLTGESIPIDKNIGSEVFAGSLCENGTLEVKVTKSFQNTRLSKIIELVEEAQASKAPSQAFVDKFAKIYTPAVLIIAVLIFIVPVIFFSENPSTWLYRALVLLVIACPCALVISTPIAIVSSLAALAKNGVLVKGGIFLEKMGALKAIALDKTGTLTEGKPKVSDIIMWNDSSKDEILRVAAAIESKSKHPLALAIVAHAEGNNIVAEDATQVEALGGKGVSAVVSNHEYFLGNHKFAHDLGVCSPELEARLQKIEASAQSVVIVGHKTHGECAGKVFGIISLSDQLRASSVKAIQDLKKSGIESITMLSGDNQRTASAIASAARISSAVGDLLPEDKVKEILKLKNLHQEVAMVGDGINDAPALAAASLGIAMGGGTDTAIETADVALMKNDLSMLAKAVQHAKRTVYIIKFNISFSIGSKIIFLALALFGLSSLWVAVAADMGASLLVAGNSLRLLKIK